MKKAIRVHAEKLIREYGDAAYQMAQQAEDTATDSEIATWTISWKRSPGRLLDAPTRTTLSRSLGPNERFDILAMRRIRADDFDSEKALCFSAVQSDAIGPFRRS